jgi:hypothetical protein
MVHQRPEKVVYPSFSVPIFRLIDRHQNWFCNGGFADMQKVPVAPAEGGGDPALYQEDSE